jgi:glycosyltransferase involved in cell wall biosynthesis
MTRIALVCDWCLPRFGGLELQLIDLAQALASAGHAPQIVTATPGPSSLDGIVVHRLRGLRFPHFGFTSSPRQFSELSVLLAGGAFDVVHIHSGVIAPLAYGCARMAAKRGIPTAFTFHSVYDYLAPVLRTMARLSNARTFPIAWSAVSRHVAAEASRALDGARVDVLPNGIDPLFWAAAIPSVRPQNELRLIAVMRLQVRKRPRDLFPILNAAQRAVGASMRITLDIVGDGPERSIVSLFAAKEGANRVRVHGRLTREEIRTLFAHADAFILPTRMESFGIAALEAVCAGLPVIARRRTGIEDFVTNGDNGLLGDSIDELASAVVELARNEPRRAEMARRNRTATSPYGWDRVVAATLEQYERASGLR